MARAGSGPIEDPSPEACGYEASCIALYQVRVAALEHELSKQGQVRPKV